MAKQSKILVASLIIVVAVLGFLFYFVDPQFSNTQVSNDQISLSPYEGEPNFSIDEYVSESPVVPPEKDGIIRCSSADGSQSYSNTGSCQMTSGGGLTVIPTRSNERSRLARSTRNTVNNRRQISRSQSPAVSDPTDGLPADCAWVVGRALHLESLIGNSKQVANESVWKKEYCERVCEIRKKQCQINAQALQMLNLCPATWAC